MFFNKFESMESYAERHLKAGFVIIQILVNDDKEEIENLTSYANDKECKSYYRSLTDTDEQLKRSVIVEELEPYYAFKDKTNDKSAASIDIETDNQNVIDFNILKDDFSAFEKQDYDGEKFIDDDGMLKHYEFYISIGKGDIANFGGSMEIDFVTEWMQEQGYMTNNENGKVEQPFFEVMDLRTHKPKYHKDGSIKWKELKTKKGKPLRKKTYSLVWMKNVKIKHDYIVREDILKQSEEQFSEIGEFIPVLLSPDGVLLNGYEQYLLAKEKNWVKLPFIPLKLNSKEKNQRKKLNNKKRRTKPSLSSEEKNGIAVGNTYYVQSSYSPKQCFKVQVVEVIDDKTVMAKGLAKKKNGGKTAKPFKINISSLHTSASKAVGGYSQKH